MNGPTADAEEISTETTKARFCGAKKKKKTSFFAGGDYGKKPWEEGFWGGLARSSKKTGLGDDKKNTRIGGEENVDPQTA